MTPHGMVVLQSPDSVDATYTRLKTVVAERGLRVFADLDFGRDAASVGLSMLPAKLLLFGNPRAGTPLIQESPTVAIDLPLKILIWQAQDGQTLVGYNTAEYLGGRHDVAETLWKNIEAISRIADAAVEKGGA